MNKNFYKTSEEYYNRILKRNDHKFIPFISILDKYNVKSVLDLGCGAGQSTNILSSKYDVIGTDVSDLFIKKAKEMYPKVKFAVEDIECLSFDDNTFDAVVLIDVIEHIENIEKAISEVKRVLKPNGIALAVFPNHLKFNRDNWLICLKKILGIDNKIYKVKTDPKKWKLSSDNDIAWKSNYFDIMKMWGKKTYDHSLELAESRVKYFPRWLGKIYWKLFGNPCVIILRKDNTITLR